MAKVINKTKGFSSISRDCVFDNELSDRARFLYVYMACKPSTWEFYQDKVAEELNYKKHTLRKYLDELIIRGWVTELEQQNDGKFGCLEYIIEIERKRGNLPIRKKPDMQKMRIGKNSNQRNIEDISSDNKISSDIRDLDKKTKTKVLSKKVEEQKVLLTDDEQRFNAHMEKEYSWVQKMKEPLSFDQYMRLHTEFKYEFDQIEDILSKMDNYPNLHKSGRIAYKTALNWLKREYPNREAI